MKKVYLKLSGTYGSLYSNAMHANCHSRVYKLLDNMEDVTIVNLTEDDLREYLTSIEAEKDLTREARKSSITEDKQAANSKRCLTVSYLCNLAANGKNSPDKNYQEASKHVGIVTDLYRNIQNEADNAITQLIDGLITDLRKDKYASYVETLGISSAIDALEEANREFENLQIKHTSERSTAKLDLNTRDQRMVTDDLCEIIFDNIFAAQILCTDTEKSKIIEQLIRDINSTIEEFRTSYNRSKGIKKKKNQNESDRPVIPDETDDSETPDDTEEPDETENPDTEEPGEEDDRPVIPEEPEPGKDENGDDLPPIE